MANTTYYIYTASHAGKHDATLHIAKKPDYYKALGISAFNVAVVTLKDEPGKDNRIIALADGARAMGMHVCWCDRS